MGVCQLDPAQKLFDAVQKCAASNKRGLHSTPYLDLSWIFKAAPFPIAERRLVHSLQILGHVTACGKWQEADLSIL